MKAVVNLVSVLATVILTGCATYGGNANDALQQVQSEQYESAETSFKEILSPNGNDALLYYLELGMVSHLQGDFDESNRLLEQAYGLADNMNSAGFLEKLRVAMSNPRNSKYRGADYERALINYVKALNFILSAQQADRNPTDLEAARVEIRRLDILLSQMEVELGNYDEAASKDKSRFGRLNNLFRTIQGQWFNPEDLLFRTDAWSLYLSGLTYELNNEMDDARISYQQSYNAYKSGFAEQYGLDQAIVEQVQWDWVRTALNAGFTRGELEYVTKNFSDTYRRKLPEARQEKTEIILIQHLDLIQPRGEMNFYVYIEPWSQLLVLEPLFFGTNQQQNDQFAWFLMLYADLGLTDLIGRYASGGAFSTLEGVITKKKIPMGPFWNQLKQLGVIDAIGVEGLRVTVPYYPNLNDAPGPSAVTVNGKVQNLLPASSPNRIAMQELIRQSPQILRESIARELLKATTGQQISNLVSEEDEVAGALLDLVSKIATVATSKSETRSWLTLPGEIRMARIEVPPGEVDLQLSTQWAGVGGSKTQNFTVQVQPGQKKIVLIPTMTNSSEFSSIVY